jgi:hypothetical protein
MSRTLGRRLTVQGGRRSSITYREPGSRFASMGYLTALLRSLERFTQASAKEEPMLMQTFETFVALFALCFLRLSALTPVGVAQALGSVLGILVGVALPLGVAMKTRKQLNKL